MSGLGDAMSFAEDRRRPGHARNALGWTIRPGVHQFRHRAARSFDVFDPDGECRASVANYRAAVRAAVALMLAVRP